MFESISAYCARPYVRAALRTVAQTSPQLHSVVAHGRRLSHGSSARCSAAVCPPAQLVPVLAAALLLPVVAARVELDPARMTGKTQRLVRRIRHEARHLASALCSAAARLRGLVWKKTREDR